MSVVSLSSHEPSPDRKRVLFFAETVTLAHAARPAVLASALDPDRYDVCLAWDPRYSSLFPKLPCLQRPIRSIESEQFLTALAKGHPLYSVQTLRSYVREDLQVIDEIKPDVIVGDFRLSLAVSARLAKVPYVAISNAYWSPYARQVFPMPELPLLRFTGVRLGEWIFRTVRPVAFAMHCRPLNRVCKEFGVPQPGYDLRRVYTHADYVVYAGLPELAPTYNAPGTHRYIGPVLWNPDVPLPEWWDEVANSEPLIYVTLGSSGATELLPRVFQAVSDLGVTAVVATAGRLQVKDKPSNVYVADYLPGETIAARSALVICNGGSPTTYQAFAAGAPVLGIASNMDQYLNMQCIERFGAGRVLRADQARAASIRAAIREILDSAFHRGKVDELVQRIHSTHSADRFAALIHDITKSAPLSRPLQARC